jgi:predicted Fe-Mo cluster-binding NifX family protein
MKIAIASTGKTEDSDVSEVSGRAPYYLVFEDGRLVKTIKNPFAVGGGGAGFGVAKMLADEHVELVVAGKFGGNMEGALKEKGL